MNQVNVRKFYLILLILVAFGAGNTYAQLTIVNDAEATPKLYKSNPSQARESSINAYLADTLAIPFFDDFTDESYTLDTLRWPSNTTVARTVGYAIMPPSRGVATLDGINIYGNPHFPNVEVPSDADSLVSAPINLAGESIADSEDIIMSFFYQMKGLGEQPDNLDSLRLFFMNAEGEWIKIWNQGNGPTVDSTIFYQVSFNLDELAETTGEDYYHAGFKFKFQNTADPTGPFDQWHLDYIYVGRPQILNSDNTLTSYLNDRSLVSISPNPVLKSYTSVPLPHFLADPSFYLANKIDATYRSLRPSDGSDNIVAEINIQDNLGNVLIDTSSGVIVLQGNSITQETSSIETLSVPDYSVMLSDSLYLNTTLTLIKEDQTDLAFRNDTIQISSLISNFFAYDDGSSESAVYLRGTQNRLAIGFESIVNDTLTGMDIHFPYYEFPSGGESITLQVWGDIRTRENEASSETLLYEETVTVRPGGYNQYTRYNFNTAIPIPAGNFYVGYKQLGSKRVSVGYDRNTTSNRHIFESIDGTYWQQPDLKTSGSAMLRPVFGDFIVDENPTGFVDTRNLTSKFYPNPVSDNLHLQTKAKRVQLATINGQILLEQKLSGAEQDTQTISLQHIPPGVYLLIFYSQNTQQIEKIVKL
jgi:hypothetical protein